MKYLPELGFFGNLERAFKELTKTNNNVFNTQTEVTQIDSRVTSSEEVNSITFVYLAEAGAIDNVTAGEHKELFEVWTYPMSYKGGQLRIDPLDGCLYRVNEGQAHTSQEGWNPSLTPALWSKASDPAEEYPDWSQPLGAHDAYALGAKVTHKDKKWTSDIDNNVYEPSVYGWTEVVTE